MGRGRKGLIEQSQKKPKKKKSNAKGNPMWGVFRPTNNFEQKNISLPDEFIEAMKKMNPQQLTKCILKTR